MYADEVKNAPNLISRVLLRNVVLRPINLAHVIRRFMLHRQKKRRDRVVVNAERRVSDLIWNERVEAIIHFAAGSAVKNRRPRPGWISLVELVSSEIQSPMCRHIPAREDG